MADAKHDLHDAAEENTSKRLKVDVEANSQRRPEEAEPRAKGIQEEDVGITEYISQANNGFSGILKQRYYDFLVNEIDSAGNVIHLTDEGVQNRKERRKERKQLENQYKTEDKKESVEEAPVAEAEPAPRFELKPEHRIELLTHFGEEDLTKIEGLLTTGSNMESAKSFNEKSERGKIHQLLRVAFEGKLESITTDTNTFKIALQTRGARSNRNTQRNNSKDNVAESDFGLGPVKDHLMLTVYKENKETMEVAALLARFLKIPSKWIKYAGTKDRRGVTVQRLSIERMRVNRVNNLNRILKGIRIGSFAYSDTPLQLGDLKGNEFVITIKEADHYDKTRPFSEVVADSVSSLQNMGFINYFGMQRFGTFSISTHEVGVKLLQGKWKDAAELLLSEQELVAPDSIEARKIWAETKNASLAASKMPKRCSAECAILEALTREKLNEANEYNDNSYFLGIMKVPRNLRIMYGHAYQSYVWNCVVSKRMQLFGTEVVEGDLVIDTNESTVKENSSSGTGEADGEFEEDVKADKFIRARPITAEEAVAKKFTIYDVVLPTPGFDVLYPTNPQLKKVYEEVMAKDNLEPENMSRRVREFSLAGSYRNILSKASNVSYYIRKYNNNDETLVKTDLDILRAKQEFQKQKIDELFARKEDFTQEELQKAVEDVKNSNDAPTVEQIDQGIPEGSKTAVIIKMQLGVSSYATMALRELMKKDTSRRGDVCNVIPNA